MKIDTANSMIQNLKDAGCNDETISSFMAYTNIGKIKEGLKLLEKYRNSILDDLHKNQKQIDCLDYFIYQMRMSNRNLNQ